MSSKKKKKPVNSRHGRVPKQSVTQPNPPLPPGEEIKERAKLLSDQHTQRQVVERLRKAFVVLSAPPEGFLPMLERLGVNWEEIDPSSDFYLNGDYAGFDEPAIIIKVRDLEEGEKRNQMQGSIFKRLYGESMESVLGQPLPETKDVPNNPVKRGPDVDEVLIDEAKNLREPEPMREPEPIKEGLIKKEKSEVIDNSFEAEPKKGILFPVIETELIRPITDKSDDFDEQEDMLRRIQG